MGASMIFASLIGVLGGGAGLFNVLFPQKQQYDVPWEGLSDALGVHVNDYQKQVGEALTKIQTDFTTFYALVNNGGFSQVRLLQRYYLMTPHTDDLPLEAQHQCS